MGTGPPELQANSRVVKLRGRGYILPPHSPEPVMVRRLLATFAIPLIVTAPLAAQSTDLEREAGRSVLHQIDSLERALDVTGTATRLAARPDATRDKMFTRVDEIWTASMQGLSDWIGHHPEVGWHEFQAVDTLTAVLKSAGFQVTLGVA